MIFLLTAVVIAAVCLIWVYAERYYLKHHHHR
jgi:hypothetical protein